MPPSKLTPSQKAAIHETVLTNPYIPAKPTRKQLEFLLREEREVFYGGAAGGGKSVALLMAALQYVMLPGYAALILRRSYTDLSLPGALMDAAKGWLAGTDAKWSEIGKTWTFPSGATLTFGYLETDMDKYRYQSTEFQFIAFDELTQFEEEQYLYLFSRLRRTDDNPAPLRVRGASNPGNIGHQWVKARFIEPAGVSPERAYVPASLDDNPYLSRDEYTQSLQLLDAVTQAQLLRGDWDIQTGGNLFKPQWFPLVNDWPKGARSVRYWDLAATEKGDWTAGARVAELGGRYWVVDIRRLRATPREVEQLVRQTADLDGTNVPIHIEQEPGSSGVNTISHYQRSVLAGYAVYPDRVTGSKVERAGPASSAAQAGNISLVNGPWVRAFIDEASLFPEGPHDDMVDAVSGALGKLGQGNSDRFLTMHSGKVRG